MCGIRAEFSAVRCSYCVITIATVHQGCASVVGGEAVLAGTSLSTYGASGRDEEPKGRGINSGI